MAMIPNAANCRCPARSKSEVKTASHIGESLRSNMPAKAHRHQGIQATVEITEASPAQEIMKALSVKLKPPKQAAQSSPPMRRPNV